MRGLLVVATRTSATAAAVTFFAIVVVAGVQICKKSNKNMVTWKVVKLFLLLFLAPLPHFCVVCITIELISEKVVLSLSSVEWSDHI